MQDPELRISNNGLHLTFPGWSKEKVKAIREGWITWFFKPGEDNILVAELLLLPLWELKETFPDVKMSTQTREQIRLTIGRKTTPVDIGFDFGNLYAVQHTPTLQLFNRSKALLQAAPGLGKTIMALTAVRVQSCSLLTVVAPLTSFDSWAREIRTWYLDYFPQDSYTLHLWRERKDVSPLEENSGRIQIVLTTPDTINSIQTMTSAYGEGLGSVFYDASDQESFLILDESFLFQNRKALRTDLMGYLVLNFKNVWLLSGMPVSKVNDDLFSQLKLLYPKTFRSYWKFAARYCLIEDTYWGSKIVGNRPGATEKLLRDLADILISCEYPKEIPDWIFSEEYCPMTTVQEQAYLEAKNLLRVHAKTLGSRKTLTISNLLTLTLRLRQIASNAILIDGQDSSGKWDRLLTLIEGGKKPGLIWIKYNKTASLLHTRIQLAGWNVEVLTGATKPKKRMELVDRFQAGELDYLIINEAVGKYSLTLTAAKVAYYVERDYNGESYYQSLYRAKRIVSKHPVEIVCLLSTLGNGGPTVDQLVHDTLKERADNALKMTIKQLLESV